MGNESFMMLIREEGEPISSTPFDQNIASSEETLLSENQVANWADAAVFVFNVTDQTSFEVLSTYYERLCIQAERFVSIPIILVGTQDYKMVSLKCVMFRDKHAGFNWGFNWGNVVFNRNCHFYFFIGLLLGNFGSFLGQKVIFR